MSDPVPTSPSPIYPIETMETIVSLPTPAGSTPVDPASFGTVFKLAEAIAAGPEPHEYLLPPFIPAGGRSIAIVAQAKSGKSLFCLECVLALVTGMPYLGRTEWVDPVKVLYLDREMTSDDVRERLISMLGGDDLVSGTDPEVNALIELVDENLTYILAPLFPPLDTAQGGAKLMELVTANDYDVVVLDTFSRFVSGNENDSSTAQSYHAHTGGHLKGMGVTLLRLDHLGKDHTAGARGSSAKVEDVDGEFTVTVDLGAKGKDDTLKITVTASRTPWLGAGGPWKIERRKDGNTPIHFLRESPVDATAVKVAKVLDHYGVNVDASGKQARKDAQACLNAEMARGETSSFRAFGLGEKAPRATYFAPAQQLRQGKMTHPDYDRPPSGPYSDDLGLAF